MEAVSKRAGGWPVAVTGAWERVVVGSLSVEFGVNLKVLVAKKCKVSLVRRR